MATYKCAECGAKVTIKDAVTIIRSCDHKDAAVIAEMEAKAEGHGRIR